MWKTFYSKHCIRTALKVKLTLPTSNSNLPAPKTQDKGKPFMLRNVAALQDTLDFHVKIVPPVSFAHPKDLGKVSADEMTLDVQREPTETLVETSLVRSALAL
uniref:Uncharacterized protein n=1 Tax=Cacopsylla melanoneura TaxID=428564 RepID=A0A8D8Q849_9HEMI